MSTLAPLTIALAELPPTDAFGLQIVLDGLEVTFDIVAQGPGRFRRGIGHGVAEDMLREGTILGFLQRGPLLTPVLMPQDGWLLSLVPDGVIVGHGTPLCRCIKASGALVS